VINMPEEKIYTIPLRKVWRTPRTRRAKKAISVINDYLKRHTKAKEIKIGQTINTSVWARGIQKPPRRIRIHVTLEDGVCYSEIIGQDIKTPTKEQKVAKEKKQEGKKQKIKEAREERKKMSMQQELDESGKTETVKETPEEPKKEEKLEEKKEAPKIEEPKKEEKQ